MDYFEYRASRTDSIDSCPVPVDVLTFTGEERIEVDEDHTVTVDDIRKYIARMNQHPAGDEAKQLPLGVS